ARLLARQCVYLEVDIRRVLFQPAEKPRLAENDGGPFLAKGIFRVSEREARHLVLQHEIAKERERSHHLRAVRVTGRLVEIRAQHPGAPRVREGEELVSDPDRMTFGPDSKTNLRRLGAFRLGHR